MSYYGELEKRIYKRFALKFQVEVENLHNHRILSLVSKDISAGGLGISKLAPEGMEIFTDEEVLPESKVGVKMVLPGCDNELILKGDVKWAQRLKTGIWRAGIEFEKPQLAINKYYIEEVPSEDKKRTKPRYCRLFQIEMRKSGSRQINVGLSADLSNDGMQIFSDVVYSTDTTLEIYIPVFGKDKNITVRGQVLWARQEEGSTWRMGIRFEEPIDLTQVEQV